MASDLQKSPIATRFDHLLNVISSQRFLRMEGIGKEVPFFVVPYCPTEHLEIEAIRGQLINKLRHKGIRVLEISASASKSEKTQAIKDVAAIKKQLKELEDYEKTLFEVAARKIDIDLDDGVKHNYLLFGSVLRKIPGLDAKDD